MRGECENVNVNMHRVEEIQVQYAILTILVTNKTRSRKRFKANFTLPSLTHTCTHTRTHTHTHTHSPPHTHTHLFPPIRHNLLPELLLESETGACGHKPAVTQATLVQVSTAKTIHHKIRAGAIDTDVLEGAKFKVQGG